MNFNDTPEEAKYRAAVKAWLAKNGADFLADRPGAPPMYSPEYLAEARRWQALKAEAGYACILAPQPWGPGGTPMERAIYLEEEAAFGIDFLTLTGIGEGIAVLTLLAVASDELKARMVPSTMRGERFWSQLFSEPSGGSDVAAARTRAVRSGDKWIVNGQKIWSTSARYTDNALLLVRTDPDVPKHMGLTMFVCDMKDPAIEVRPIHQMNDEFEFNEVFFNDLVLTDADVIGEVGGGWRAAIAALMLERVAVGGATGPQYEQVMELARQVQGPSGSLLAEPTVRAKLADLYISLEGLRLTRLRALTALSRGSVPGPENSIGKLIAGQAGQDLANFAIEIEDQFGVINDPAVARMGAVFQKKLLSSPSIRIAGGTDEIMKNIIAERVLNLPGDIRADKDVPFRDLPQGR